MKLPKWVKAALGAREYLGRDENFGIYALLANLEL